MISPPAPDRVARSELADVVAPRPPKCLEMCASNAPIYDHVSRLGPPKDSISAARLKQRGHPVKLLAFDRDGIAGHRG